MNPVEKATFNEGGICKEQNRDNEVLFKVREKDESRDRGRVCFPLKKSSRWGKKKSFQILMTLYDLQQFDKN